MPARGWTAPETVGGQLELSGGGGRRYVGVWVDEGFLTEVHPGCTWRLIGGWGRRANRQRRGDITVPERGRKVGDGLGDGRVLAWGIHARKKLRFLLKT